MIKQLLQVEAFMKTFEQEMHTQPVTECPEHLTDLGFKLAREETYEMLDAIKTHEGVATVDPALMLDALCDQIYIALGNAHRFGLALILPVAFRRVHVSNMSKLWSDEEIGDLDKLKAAGGHTYKPVMVEGKRKWIVYNKQHKVIKSPSYTPANLHDLLDDLEGQNLLDFSHANRIVYGELPEPDFNPDDYPDEL